ncbi:hypothetical protein CLM62_38550 [Streptomyces sp. SA15]|uniref:hypothetical protein n=1 Tax=Streptomyces sp. SA15 TaxID=934019 RepID=UPI000BAFDB18|nr:hypothetical protein [Streptomyces sp. SA15]PAZ10897.1 hypothetical protein CLM62_38550 [Streptomyces sp. SA15]
MVTEYPAQSGESDPLVLLADAFERGVAAAAGAVPVDDVVVVRGVQRWTVAHFDGVFEYTSSCGVWVDTAQMSCRDDIAMKVVGEAAVV